MKIKAAKKVIVILSALSMLFTVSCSPGRNAGQDTASSGSSSIKDTFQSGSSKDAPDNGQEKESQTTKNDKKESGQTQSFAEAHDAFKTTLAREENDDDPIADPPEGYFDLIKYPSTVGDLAAYVSSDPGDGEKHPLIIWVVGGWGNGIDDFPWCYPAWDNDQTGSAFWQADILMMYPSFRGGNGNPGHYEALFGEVDDIAAAYDYAASLPYVDPDRIYLGGHSTGATRALLAAEYTDKFRAVFCFGAVDEVKYHNNSQFTFDTSIEEEFTMRSPIHWLDDIKTPTFLIEGSDGNADNLKNIENATDNENIHCYVIPGQDHFSVLAPLTRVAAEKILSDTGAEPDITITQEELESAMKQDPVTPLPLMMTFTDEDLGLSMSYPFLWEVQDVSKEGEIAWYLTSMYEEDNVWDLATLYIDAYEPELGVQEIVDSLKEEGLEATPLTINGMDAVQYVDMFEDEEGYSYQNTYVIVFTKDAMVSFDFYIPEYYGEDAKELFQTMIDSIRTE